MDPITQQTVLAAAGAGGGAKTYVDDVFSTYLYEGNGGTKTITNGIDLAGEGGLTWVKCTSHDENHILVDTERGVSGYGLITNSTGTAYAASNLVTAFNSNGFTVGANGTTNSGSQDYASWSFRKAPGFFDVVTYTGDGTSTQTINHSLGSIPGCIIFKDLDNNSNWWVYHRSATSGKHLELNTTNAEVNDGGSAFSALTSTSFTFDRTYVSSINTNAANFVAYIFAHDDAQYGTGGDESIIKCGSYTGGGTTDVEVNLGFEPQFVLLRCTTRSGGHGGGWYLFDSMRGINTGSVDPTAQAQEANAPATSNNANISLTPTGFITDGEGLGSNANGGTYVYIAIRRPNKPPEVATEVFDDVAYTGLGNANTVSFSPAFADLIWIKNLVYGYSHVLVDRLRGGTKYVSSDSNGGDATLNAVDSVLFDRQESFKIPGPGYSGGQTNNGNAGYNSYISWVFKRAPGFMDIVAYTGTVTGNSDSQTVPHNLGVTPELMLIKRRSGSTQWEVYSDALTNPLTEKLVLNDSGDASAASNSWGTSSSPTAPNANNFTVGYSSGTGFVSSGNFIAYLFATLPGISKVGSYSGTGNEINVNCGFTAGARFVLIKRTDSSSDWYVWDTARGYNGTSDNFTRLNSSAAQDDNIANIDDHLGALTTGFTVKASSGVNTSGGNYLFLAIA